MPLYDELWAMEGCQKIPGGSALNSARSLNFILKNQGSTTKVVYFGSISKDEKGETLEKCLKEEGVIGNFHYSTEAPTGSCAVVVHQKERSMCANLAAACKYDSEHLHNNMEVFKNSNFIYTTSFFITSNPGALHEIAQYASDNNVLFGFNLSAVFLLQFELDNVMKALKHADFVFANEDEAAAYGVAHKMGECTHQDVAKAIARTEKSNKLRQRYVIITMGPAPIIVANTVEGSDEIQLREFAVVPLEHDNITDTNGAGDSFVGGFFSQIAQGKSIETAISAGIYLSREVVQ
jgi:adenosine kinase